ncbi:hypothetical protein LC082_08585 [Microbacterium esteraromaticum]|uniref:hypothetical protein n=1 Tax=Microbacterium esteraromaticum TaxID=57043 RepID=UPI001CD58557|nr:hypothetical protein [Microbacterium esteraromaticum]MCA1306954.1 hypothetical protein [Microbacterium esteraromaticum]
MKKKSLLISALAIALFFSGSSIAHAETEPTPPPSTQDESVSPSACSPGRVTYFTTITSSGFKQASGAGSSVTGGPGVTLSISRSTTFSVTGTISGTADVSAGAARGPIEARVGGSIGGSVSGTFSGTSTTSGSWTVPRSYKIGRLAIGAVKYKGKVQKVKMVQACNLVNVGSPASFDVPRAEWSFRHTKVQ